MAPSADDRATSPPRPGAPAVLKPSVTKIWYGVSRDALAGFPAAVLRLASAPEVTRVCEIGGGANPSLSPEFLARHGIDYTVLDISADELAKAPAAYHKVQGDIAAVNLDAGSGYDLVLSQWCAEHVSSGRRMHENVWKMLAPGGRAIHLFPTLYSAPFVINRLVPETLSEMVLHWLQPHRLPEGNHGKFPARYHWCRGPIKSQMRRFEGLGFEVEEYAGFFGHSGDVAYDTGYWNRIPPICRLHELRCRMMTRYPVAALTSVAYVVVRRPE